MITQINRYEMRDALMNDEYGGFSTRGSAALANWLDTFMPEDAMFNVIEVRCAWSEYESFSKLAENYENCPQDSDKAIRRWLLDRTAIIEFTGGIIIREF